VTVVVAAVGATSLGTEIAVTRLIAPFYGASTLVWANTIAVVLLALSVGYWFGGRLADRRPTTTALCTVVLAASVLLGAVPYVAEPFLRLSAKAFSSLSVGIFAGSLLALLVLVAIPVALVGAVAPWAIRLRLAEVADAGQTSGRLYAVSTAGSLVGSFAAALVLIPYVGTHRTFLILALLLAVVAAPALPRAALVVPVALAVAIVVPPGQIKPAAVGQRVLYETETQYQFAEVVEQPDGTRLLQLNEGQADHSIYRPGTVFTGGYWDSLLTLPAAVLHHPPRSMAVLGNAAGTVDRAYAHYFPATRIDAVELDGALTDIGFRYFGLRRRPQLHLITADARPWLAAQTRRYDLIIVDAYRQPYIPFYLTTDQFFAVVRAHLQPGGVVLVNVGQPPGQTQLERVLAATIRTDFPHVERDPVAATNTMLVVSTAPINADLLRHAALPPALRTQAATEAAQLGAPLPGGAVYTDDKAPIEQLVDGSLLNYATAPSRP